MQAPFYHPLNITLTKLLNKSVKNIRGQSIKLFKQSFRLYLSNALRTTRPLFHVTLDSGTTTVKSAFLDNIMMLRKIYFADLIALGDVVLAIDSISVININFNIITKVQWQLSQIRVFNQF